MTDAFSDLVMPIFKQVIDLRDKLSWPESAENQVVASLEEVKKSTREWVDKAERRSKTDATLAEEFEMAKYGLVAWIDEVLTDSVWGQKVGWGSDDMALSHASADGPEPDWGHRGGRGSGGSQRLEWDLFGTNLRAGMFYDKAKDISTSIGQSRCSADPLEAMLLCVALGFRGEKKDDEDEFQDWVQRTYARVAETNPLAARPFPDEPAEASPGLTPRQGPSLLLTVSVLGAITVVSTAVGVMLSVYARYKTTY